MIVKYPSWTAEFCGSGARKDGTEEWQLVCFLFLCQLLVVNIFDGEGGALSYKPHQRQSVDNSGGERTFSSLLLFPRNPQDQSRVFAVSETERKGCYFLCLEGGMICDQDKSESQLVCSGLK